MEIKHQPRLTFHGVDFVNVHFDSKEYYNQKNQIDFNIAPKVMYSRNKDDDKIFRIIMEVVLNCKDFFKLSLTAVGAFELEKAINDDLKKTFINANAPAIMFPYVRSFISTLTGNLGNITGVLNIPTQFFKGELEEFNSEESNEKKLSE